MVKLVCAPAHPPLAERINRLYETAYTRVNGEYYPCHPDVCCPLTEVSPSPSPGPSTRTRITNDYFLFFGSSGWDGMKADCDRMKKRGSIVDI